MPIEHHDLCAIPREYIDVALETLLEIAIEGKRMSARAAAAEGLRARGFGHLLDQRLAALAEGFGVSRIPRE